jgi:hypothetical protein
MTLHKCQVVARDERWFNPSTRTLIAVKLMDAMVCPPLGSIDHADFLKECPATVGNKMATFGRICGECDIFVASATT